MNKIICKTFAILAIMLSGTSITDAQNLKSLPGDPAVTQGILPDGVSYFLASNNTRKGVADMALVWRAGVPVPEDSSVVETPVSVETIDSIARTCLASTPIFGKRSPETFLRDHGIRSGRFGYIERKDNAVVFRFNDISLSRNGDVRDSLLLMTFDMIRSYSAALKERGLKDCGQAIVISGDIDKGAFQEKMKMLSLFVPEIKSADLEDIYVWEQGDNVRFKAEKDTVANIATVSAMYRGPRTPKEYMNTVLPLVSTRMGNELGLLLKKRLAKIFLNMRIPVAEIGHDYIGSAETSGDEKYILFVKTAPEYVSSVIPVMSAALSELASSGIRSSEYSEVRKAAGRQAVKDAGMVIRNNSLYVDRCISAFLYGSSLSSMADRSGFFVSSALADSSGCRYFNKYASSLIDRIHDLTFSYKSDTCQVTEEEMSEIFVNSWNSGSSLVYTPVNMNDTTGFDVSLMKCKIKSFKEEPLSGGKLWTFANGMKVVYKQMPADGRFWYSMIIRGGTASVNELRAGSGAYFADMLSLFNVNGMRPDNFKYLLSAKDIDMNCRAGVSDMGIYGSAASNSLDFLMKALIAVTKADTVDEDAFQYYLECERLRLRAEEGTRGSRYVAIDSLMCPGYRYSVFKSESGLSYNLKEEAEAFCRSQFAKVNDGIFVIVGDLDEYELRKKLQEYMGGFAVTSRFMPRPSQTFQPISGESTYIVDGISKSVDVAMSSSIQLSAANYMAAKIASLAVEDAVISDLDGVAAGVYVSDYFSVVPTERFNLMITLEEKDLKGFSTAAQDMRPVHELFVIRSVIDRLASENISAEKLSLYKSMLKNSISSYSADPRYWVDMITRRFSDGKNLHTDYAAKIDAVTVDQVREIILALDNSGKVEYIVRPAGEE